MNILQQTTTNHQVQLLPRMWPLAAFVGRHAIIFREPVPWTGHYRLHCETCRSFTCSHTNAVREHREAQQ